VAAVAVAALLGCGKKDHDVVRADNPASKTGEAEKKDAGAVTLDAAKQKEAGIVIQTVALKGLPQVIRATAKLTQDENSTFRVGAVTEGRIVSVLAAVGDKVVEDQILARMHSHDIHESRAEYQKAKAELKRAESAEVFARKVRDRARRLYELKAGTLADAEHSESEVRNAQTVVSNAQTEVARTRFHLEDFLGVPAEDQHGPTGDHTEDEMIPVRAPSAGVVVARNVSIGSVVTTATDLFQISDLRKLWAIAEMQEEVMPRLRVGMPARLFVNAYGDQPFPSRIAKIGDSLDPVTRTVKVRLELSNPGMKLRPEMYGTAEIDMGSVESAVMLPLEAVQDVRGASVVFVQTSPVRFELRPVETGRTRDGMLEIRRGLSAGDQVAVKGVFILKSEFLKASLAEEE
jgi:cobalt-zinc-cadmium efflux system membrane fusion protein